MDVRKLMEAEMTLMEDKELIMGMNYPDNDIISVCEHVRKRLGEFIEQVKATPSDYIQEGDDKLPREGASRYQLEIKLVRLTDDYFKNM